MGASGKNTKHAHTRAEVAAAVMRQAIEHPQRGQGKVAAELRRMGYRISNSGVRYLWRKQGLETTYKRLKALARSIDGSGRELSAAQKERLRRGEVTRKLARAAGQHAHTRALPASDERRRQILYGAAELFVKHGYAGTSIRDIAQRTGLLPGSVYHYYPAKDDLYIAIHREGFRELIARVEAIERAEADPWRRLELACAAHIDAAVGDNSIQRITGAGLFSLHELPLQRRLRQDREHYEQVFRRLIDGLGLPRNLDRSLFRLVLLGALNWAHVWYRKGKKPPVALAHAMMTIFRGDWAQTRHTSGKTAT